MAVNPGKSTVAEPASALAIAAAGAVSLAVAMGIGRFAFTPILPMMLSDGVVNLPQASVLASANYLGYMLGALLCTIQPFLWSRWQGLPALRFVSLIRAGLVATALLTVSMALDIPAAWPALRFAAGVASAVVFVFTSGWCMSQLTRCGRPTLGGLIYVGPGAGIVTSGLLASGMVAWQWRASVAWLVFALLAVVLMALAWPLLRGEAERLAPRSSPPARSAATGSETARHSVLGKLELPVLAFAYGLAGFGYIVTATFLPVIARTALPGSAWLDLFWPMFGFGVMAGSVLATRVPMQVDRRRLLVGCYIVQAAGVACSLVWPSLLGFAVGSLMLGLPFTAITFFAMQEVRRLRPDAAASLIGLLTAFYGIGQIAGPPMVAVLLRHSATASAGFTRSLEVAAGALLVGAVLFWGACRAYPLESLPESER